jgi:2-desacetyl-2-hydroxyethyl bacteriochlorophyllide A dehydrogenase
METMKALVYEGPKIMNIRQVPLPSLKEDEVLIQVERAGICGSELSGYLGHNSLRKPPLIMGHEFSGSIAAVGERVSRFQPGDRVTANPLVSCGVCEDCHTGHANLCSSRSLIGAGRPGAFATYVAVPERNVYRMPSGMEMDEAVLAEPFACAVHACRLAKLSPSDTLFIAGAGPIGLFMLQTAKVYGLERIVVSDLNLERLDIVRELGGIPVQSEQELKKESPGRGFTVTVDAVGIDVTRQQCIQMARPGGKVIFSGLHASDSLIPINTAIRNELVMIGSFGYNPIDFEWALKWIAEGKVDLKPWIMHASLEQGQECFDRLLSNPGKVAKILLTI